MKKILIVFLVLLTVMSCLPLTVSAGEYSVFGKVVTIQTNADNIVIDGKMESGEWGEPLIVETPQSLTDKSDMGWGYTKGTNTSPNQRVEIYLVNEGGVLYVACKLIDVDYDPQGAPRIESLHQHAHFCFSMATYYEDTVVYRKLFQGDPYEYFGCWAIGMVDGRKQCRPRTQGGSNVALPESDYAVNYDAATRTYIYEVRVKEGLSQADLLKNNKIVMSFSVSGPLIEKNRDHYIISEASYRILTFKGGAGQFVHAKTKPVLVNVLETEKMVTNEYMPTDEESANAMSFQSGFVPVDEIATLDPPKTWVETATPFVAGAAIVVLISTIIFALIKRKRQ